MFQNGQLTQNTCFVIDNEFVIVLLFPSVLRAKSVADSSVNHFALKTDGKKQLMDN